MTDRNRQSQREIKDEATRRNVDPGTGGTGGALDMGMTTGEEGSNFGEVDPGVGSDLTQATGGRGDVTGDDRGNRANRPGRGPKAGRGGDSGAGSSTDVGGTVASGAGSGADMDLTNLDAPGTTVRGRRNVDAPGGEAAAHRRKGVDDDRPNAGDASDPSAFDASDAYTGIESDEALAGRERGSGASS